MDELKMKTRIQLDCDAITALAVLGSIHLALKHPLNTGPNTRLARAFYEQLCGKLAETGALSSEEIGRVFRLEEVDVDRREAQRRLREEGSY